MTGFICLDKPNDISSFWAAKQVSKLLREKKAGHTGTLDPFATGVLPVALGQATRFIELLPTSKKAYKATVQLGITTDTLDITGDILTKTSVDVSEEEIEQILSNFTGEISQTPPMFSAIRKDGVRLYDLARKGETVERESRKVTVYTLKLLNAGNDSFEIFVECSAGTYIRALADDIGSALGCGAVLTSLTRTEANGFTLEESISLEKMRQMSREELEKCVIPIDKALGIYGRIDLSPAQSKRFKNGGYLSADRLDVPVEEGYYRMYSDSGLFLGIGEFRTGSDKVTAKKVLGI